MDRKSIYSLLTILVLIICESSQVTATEKLKKCNSGTSAKLFCYYGKSTDGKFDECKCSHIILPENSPIEDIERVRERTTAKVLLTVKQVDQNLIKTLNSTTLDGLEINLSKLSTKHDLEDIISTIRSKLNQEDLFLAISVPAQTETLAKYYDFKTLSKHADVFVLRTHWLGVSKNVTFHPSRLSGLWDVQNTDSVVDLVTGLGAPLSKLVISAPVQGFAFKLQNVTHTAPGSPALELRTLDRNDLCARMKKDSWTLERDQDQAAPYIFRNNTWISFEDATSMDIKAKYARVRGLAGLALLDVSQDGGEECGGSLLEAAFEGLTKQARAPRGAVLHSLEREILQPNANKYVQNLHVSPFRISRVIDTEGKVHAIREDTRTEFQCSRQGYFVHPRSCNRFYRCVKFDQLTDEFSVFEFDCPAGLAFDERVEVCVWPGSLPDTSACSGSSEIAPVPKDRFTCPGEPGYYADPENCRWFFACMDHGETVLTAYEFRCPYGLVFDQSRLLCEWSWLVPTCASGLVNQYTAFGGQESRGGDFDLELYNGLGSLPNVKLGGISGPLSTTTAKIYSNYNLDGQQFGGQQFDGQQVGGQQNAHIDHGTSSSGLQFGSKTNLGFNGFNSEHSSHGGFVQNGINLQTNHNLNLDQNLYEQNGQQFDGQQNLGHGVTSSNGLQFGSKLGFNGFNSGTSSHGGFVQNGNNLQTDHNLNLDQNLYQQNLHQQNLHSSQNVINENQENLAIGKFNSDGKTHDTINIVNGGYSGVLNTDVKNIDHHNQQGLNLHVYQAVTPSSTIIPTVTSVPLPSTPNFETYHGQGVVANLPNLQYKLEHPLVINDQLNTFSNSSLSHQYNNNFGHYQNGFGKSNYDYQGLKPLQPEIMKTYTYNQPQILGYQTHEYQNENSGNSQYQHINNHNINQVHLNQNLNQGSSLIGSGGYNYGQGKFGYQSSGQEIPTTFNNYQFQHPLDQNIQIQSYHETTHQFEKPIVQSYQQTGYVSQKPSLTILDQTINTQQGNNFGTFAKGHKEQNVQGYQYETPVTFVESSKINALKEINEEEGYHYEKPTINFEQKPTVLPQPTVSYQEVNHEVKLEGYHYEKPSIVFEEKPKPVVVTQPKSQEGYHYQKPVVPFVEEPKVIKIQPTVAVTPQVHIQEVKQEGYHYEKPSVSFVEEPKVVKIQPTQQTVSYQEVNREVKHEGYHYQKPSIVFEETPKPIVPQPTVSYQEVNHEVQHQGYHYQKPSIVFEEKPKPIVPQPTVSYQEVKHEVEHQGYHYEKPSIAFEEKPIAPIAIPQPTVSYQEVNHEAKHQGYHYEKPAIVFEEQPRPVSVPQPTVSYQEINHEVKHEGYHYQKPSIAFEEKPIAPIAVPQPTVSYQQVNHEVKHHGYHYEKPSVVFEEKPKPIVVPQPTISYQEVNHEVKHEGYHYPKPSIVFEEKPKPTVTYQQVDHKVEHQGYHYQKPSIIFEERPKPVISQPTVSYQEVNHGVKHEGYHYQKPTVVFEEKPKPIVVPHYQEVKHEVKHEGYHYEKPSISFVEQPKVQPTIISHPTVTYQNVNQVKHQGYHYQKPAVAFIEEPKFSKVPTVPVTYQQVVHKQPTVYQEVRQGYHYQKPSVTFNEEPQVLQPTRPTIYEQPKTISTYHEYKQPVQPTYHQTYYYSEPKTPVTYNYYPVQNKNYIPPKPVTLYQQPQVFVQPKPTYKEILTQKPAVISSFSFDQYGKGYRYDKPSIVFEEEPTKKPKINPALNYIPAKPVVKYQPDYHQEQEIIEEPLVKTTAYQTGHQYIKDVIYSTPKPTYQSIVTKIEPVPLKEYKLYSYDSRLDHGYSTTQQVPILEQQTTSKPIVRYEFSSSTETPKPQFIINVPDREYLPVRTTTLRPIIVTQKQYLPPSPPKRVYIPVVTTTTTTTERYVTPTREYLPVKISRTEAPRRTTTTTTTEKYVEPTREYLPVRRTRPTTPSREYLPSRTKSTTSTERYVEPTKEYLPVRRTRPTTPNREYLPARTTTATTTTLKPTISRQYLPSKQVENYELSSTRRPKVIKVIKSRPIVKQNDFHPILSAKLGAQCTCTSNTLTLRRKPQTTRISDLEEYDSNPLPYDTKKQSVIIVAEEDDELDQNDEDRKEDINKAVNSGLKLVKSAVRQGVKEGVQEALFDRYGPGGVRGKSETLQGTIDCQRAGLFRHPTQCNKFYSCRWDCAKKKFTLHVFNCPVHLTFDNNLGACNWPSQGPACVDNTLLPN